MKQIHCVNDKTGKRAVMEVHEDGYFLAWVNRGGWHRCKFIGRTERVARRWMERKNWRILPPKVENLDIAKR